VVFRPYTLLCMMQIKRCPKCNTEFIKGLNHHGIELNQIFFQSKRLPMSPTALSPSHPSDSESHLLNAVCLSRASVKSDCGGCNFLIIAASKTVSRLSVAAKRLPQLSSGFTDLPYNNHKPPACSHRSHRSHYEKHKLSCPMSSAFTD